MDKVSAKVNELRLQMTKAAYRLQMNHVKVIDIYEDYGYTSPKAFGIAFRSVHGVNPSEARVPEVTLKYYGEIEMEHSTNDVFEMTYKVEKKARFTVLGKRATTEYNGGTWAMVKKDGSLEVLKSMAGTEEALGLCFGFDKEGNNDYMCAVPWNDADWRDVMERKVGAASQHHFETYSYPDLTWLLFLIEGKISDNILSIHPLKTITLP